MGQSLKHYINYGKHGNPIFKIEFVLMYTSENNNGDACVSDTNANIVVALDKTGSIRYDGELIRKKHSFDPGYMVSDDLSHIIVKNNCLHILEQNG